MDRPVQLIALQCLKCQTPVPAEPDEVAWVCRNCGQGLQLDVNLAKGLAPLDVFYAAGIPPNTTGKPFWVAEGRVTFNRRQTYSGNEDRDAQKFWAQSRNIFVPAFNASLETQLGLGTKMLEKPPALQAGPAVRFEPVTLAQDDVKPLAEFIVMALEANRKDKLREIQFTLQLSLPTLCILP